MLTLLLLGKDEEKRSEYLSESILLLKRATELDSRSWQAFYQLGLQQSITGDLILAINSVKRSIKLRGDFIPSWHLLSLIQSCRQFHGLPKSLQLIQAGLAYHLNMVDNEDNEDIMDNISLDTEEGQVFFDRAEAFIKLRISQAKMLETLEGSEAVLKVYPDLFDMYSKLSKKMNLEKVVVQKKSLSLHESSIKSRPRSRANSSVHSSLFEDHESLDSGFALVEENNLNESRPILNKVDEDEEDEDEDFVPKSSRKKNRNSFNLTRQLMDDPLMSFPISKKKEKKEKTNTKRSTFLGLKRTESSKKGTKIYKLKLALD